MTDPRTALQDKNVQAFLRVIRQGETNQSDIAYRMMFGGATFDDFGHHPNLVHVIGNLKSTAAGAYQFLGSTWGACQRALNLPDFSPASQDLAAVWLIANRGALNDVLAGRVEVAIAKCAREWASLPGSPYGQPTRTLGQALETYAKWGGSIQPQPVAQVESPAAAPAPAAPVPAPVNPAPSARQQEAPMGATFLWGLAQSLIGAFAPLAQEKISKEVARHTTNTAVADQIAQAVVDSAVQLTGKTDPIEAVAAAKSQPEVIKQIEVDTLGTIDRLAPVLDKMAGWDRQAWDASEASSAAAAERAQHESADLAPMLAAWAVRGMFAMIALLGLIIIAQIIWAPDHKPSGELLAALTGLMMLAASKSNTVYDYRFGSSRGSSSKDVVIAELNRRPKP